MGNCLPVPAPVRSLSSSSSPASNNSGSNFGQQFPSSSGSIKSEANPNPVNGQILDAPNLRIFTYAKLKSATRNFKPDSLIGEGGLGKVYKGWVNEKTLCPTKSGTGIVIAVKKLNPESMQGLEEWQSEVSFLGTVSHPNLVKLMGYCWEDKKLLLVHEFMAKGSLENHLFRKGSSYQSLSWDLRLQIVLQAARGLAFLHSSERRVIHRNLKASNILLDSHYTAKLSDFGLAKNGPTGEESHVTTRVMGTYGYAAPEYVATGHLYVKSDVYGFGVVLLQILSGQRALDLNRPSGQHNLVEWAKPRLADLGKLVGLMDTRLDGKYPKEAALEAGKLTLKCLSHDPKMRPSMEEVVETLDSIAAFEVRRVKSDHSQMSSSSEQRPAVISPSPVGRRRAASSRIR